MNRDELLRLRKQIVDQAQNLALSANDNVDPVTRLEVLMNIIRAGGAPQPVIQGAYDASQQLTDDSAKLDAMLDLLYEIDAELASGDSEAQGTNQQPADQPQNLPEQQQ